MSPTCHVLVVDDDRALAKMCAETLDLKGYTTQVAHDGSGALDALRGDPECRVILTDLVMPGMSGIQLLQAAKERRPDIEVIVMTSFGTIDSAVEAMKLGASEYVSKPFQPDELIMAVERVLQVHQLATEVERLRHELHEQRKFESIIGRTRQMERVYALISSVANTDANVLIEGETGTGKELVAKAVHCDSARKDGPLIKVDCAALTESLLESELFGHVHGSFTGAVRDRHGRFRMADGGTIFLDEVSNIALPVQAKLLRVLQDSEFEPVGSDAPIRVDVRVIAATNVPLEPLVDAGQFRRDLFYRLNVVKIELPPLRDRLDDTPSLVAHFLLKHSAKDRRQVKHVSKAAINKLMAYRWPGNVRELENLIERAVILCQGDTITPEDLPLPVDRYSPAGDDVVALKEALRTAERQIVLDALEKCGHDKRLAAKRLKISRASIYSKVKSLGLTDAARDTDPA